jgi:hypothetical protein
LDQSEDAVLAVSCPAQNGEIAKAKVAAGYSHLHVPFNNISISGQILSATGDDSFHRPGLWVELEWKPVPWLGISNYTGYYYLPDNVALLANIPGVATNLFDGRMTPYAVAGFGVGFLRQRGSFFGGGTHYSTSAIGR